MDLTVDIEQRTWELNRRARDHIESVAQSAFSENEYCDTYWEEYTVTSRNIDGSERQKRSFEEAYGNPSITASSGDPILVIETEGHLVPSDEVIQPQESDDTTFEYMPEERSEDEKYSVDHMLRESMEESYEEQSEDGKLPPMPAEEKEEPMFVVGLPQQDGEVWSTQESIYPVYGTYFWNVQRRIDNPPRTATGVQDSPETLWEKCLQSWDCEIVEEREPESEEGDRKPWNYKSTPDNETKDSGSVGTRWNL